MFRAIGFVIIVYALSVMLAQSFRAFDDAATAVLGAVEIAAEHAAENFDE